MVGQSLDVSSQFESRITAVTKNTLNAVAHLPAFKGEIREGRCAKGQLPRAVIWSSLAVLILGSFVNLPQTFVLPKAVRTN